MNLEVEISWQAQHLNLELQISYDFVASAALCEPRSADFVAGAALCEPRVADLVLCNT